jgi:NAD(P)H-quinone oxidoreductase subunit 5
MVAVAFGHRLVALTALHTNARAGAEALYSPISFGWAWLDTAGLHIGLDGLVTEPALIAMAVITGLHLLVDCQCFDAQMDRFLRPEARLADIQSQDYR